MTMRASPDVIHMLTSPLLTDGEIGELAGLAITLRANQNGGTHVVGCRNLSSKAGDAESVTIAAYRAADPERHPCRVCGGGTIASLSAEQDEQVAALGVVWKSRLEQEREKAAAQRRWEELTRRADVVDERARRIVDGWHWDLEKEREAAKGYPAESVSAPVTCRDCGATADITFEPRALQVRFTCSQDAEHGFLRLPGDEDDPLATWGRDGRKYVAIELVAPVLAGDDDDTWSQVYGSRASDYRATVEALAAFDAANPEPMRLTPDVRCGDCGNAMSLYIRPGLDRGDRDEAVFSCGIRHEDGRRRSRKKADVDAAIDRELLFLLRHHPSWATAAEIEPSTEALAGYASYLTVKISAYDEHIGAASKDPELSQQREALEAALRQVGAMQVQGPFAVAGLAGNHAWGWYIRGEENFTDLARALLTIRMEVSQKTIEVRTPFDAETALYRTLRSREIRDELADLQRRQHELADELTELGEE
jgi:hypothetical protein